MYLRLSIRIDFKFLIIRILLRERGQQVPGFRLRLPKTWQTYRASVLLRRGSRSNQNSQSSQSHIFGSSVQHSLLTLKRGQTKQEDLLHDDGSVVSRKFFARSGRI